MPKEGSRSGKGSRTSKTARVLSLLTDPESAAEETRPAAGADPAETKKPAEKTTATETAAHHANDAATEQQIRNALASELAGLAELAPEPEPMRSEPVPFVPEQLVNEPEPAVEAETEPPVPEPIPEPPEQATTLEPEPVPPVQEPSPAPEPEPEPAAESEPAPAPETPEENVSVEIKTTAAAPEDETDSYTVLNVTQALVEEKADKYIKMFGLCSCKRCRIDVVALALSSLPAKYVVVKGKDINPRLSFYESRYSAAVITQVMSACKKVLEKPHHER